MKSSTAPALAGVALAALLLGGCSGSAPESSGTPASPDGSGSASAAPAAPSGSTPDGEISFEGTYTQTILIPESSGESREDHEGNATAYVECSDGACMLKEIQIDDGGGGGVVFFDELPTLDATVAFSLDPEPTICTEDLRFDFPQGVEITGTFSAERLSLQINAPSLAESDDQGGWCGYTQGMELAFEGASRR